MTQPRRPGPHVQAGKLFFVLDDGSAIVCECIGEPYASQIVAQWTSIEARVRRCSTISSIGCSGANR